MENVPLHRLAQITAVCAAAWISLTFAQPSERKVFEQAFPLCFELYPDNSTVEQKACIEVSARRAHTHFERDELATAVRQYLEQQEAARRAKEQERIRAERATVTRERQYLEQQKAARRAKEQERIRAERAAAAREQVLAHAPLGVYVERWWLGGFGVVLLAEVTLQNNSANRMADFRVECRTFGNSGTALSKVSVVLYEALAQREQRTFEVNLGKVHPQSARANCTATPG